MSDQKQGNRNPFLPENFLKGGGLWDDKVVVITEAKTEVHRMAYADGSPVINSRTGEQSVQNVLTIVGIGEGDEAERREQFSAGGLHPSADGEYFVDPKTGLPGYWRENTDMGKFAANIIAGGFDVNTLFDESAGHVKVSRLVGAKFLFKGEAQKDKDGKVKKDKNGYDRQKFFPVEFRGYKEGIAAPTATNGGGSALDEKAAETVLAILAEEGGKVSRADLVKKVSKKLAGDADANKVIALIAKDSFHNDRPWVREGTGYTLQ